MKILYLSCHSILEYDECKLLTELGYDVQSHGAYRDPRGAYTLPRPGIEGMKFDQKFCDLTAIHPKTNLPPELIEPYDTIIIMSGENEAVLINNWDKIKHKRVILRTIGQSTPATEMAISRMRKEGLQIIRYSPKEENIENYVGGDALIRFYKDPEEFMGWNGNDNRPVTFAQSLKGRGQFCHYDEIMGSLVGFDDAKVYGPGNNDLGSFNGGDQPFEELKKIMRDSRCYVYGGTWPACYTLSFMEALMTGIPIVACSAKIAHLQSLQALNFYEVEDILADGDIKCYDDVNGMRDMIQGYINDKSMALDVSIQQRKLAIKYFGKEAIAKQWAQFLGE